MIVLPMGVQDQFRFFPWRGVVMAMTTGRVRLRHRWRRWHQLIGLWLGLWFSILGISGAALVFYPALDAWLNPELQISDTERPHLSYQQWFERIVAAEPTRTGRWRIELPEAPSGIVTARYYNPTETRHLGFAPLMLSIHPVSGHVLRTDFWGRYVVTWIYDLHYTLLLGPPGKILVAMLGMILLISLLSGFRLAQPPPGKWRSALTIKWSSSVGRRIYDLHRTAGLYGLPVLLILTLTGIAMGIPESVNPLVNQLSPLQVELEPGSRPKMPDDQDIGLDRAAAAAQSVFPAATLRWIETPEDEQGAYRFRLWQYGEPGHRFPKTLVWVDRYSGEILGISDPRTGGAGDTLLDWLHPLHSGEAFGLTGRLVVFVVGLACPLLLVTGWMRWCQRTRRGRPERSRAPSSARSRP